MFYRARAEWTQIGGCRVQFVSVDRGAHADARALQRNVKPMTKDAAVNIHHHQQQQQRMYVDPEQQAVRHAGAETAAYRTSGRSIRSEL